MISTADLRILYTSKVPDEQRAVLDKYYDDKVVFEDPIAIVSDKNSMAVQFNAMAKYFERVDFTCNDASSFPGGLIFNNKQVYQITRGSDNIVSIDAKTTLLVDEKTGLVVRHCDEWLKASHPSLNLLSSRNPRIVRQLFGFSSTSILRFLMTASR